MENYCQKSTYQKMQHNGGSRQENISTESMLDKEICQAMDYIRILPSILYTIVCIVVFPHLLHDSMPHIEQI